MRRCTVCRQESMRSARVIQQWAQSSGPHGRPRRSLVAHLREMRAAGAVVDFIDALRIGSHDRWPVFNVADAAIVVGVIILLVCYARRASPGGG